MTGSDAYPSSAEQYEDAVVSLGSGIPCCRLCCKGPQAMDVLHGVVPTSVALGKAKRQYDKVYLRLSML